MNSTIRSNSTPTENLRVLNSTWLLETYVSQTYTVATSKANSSSTNKRMLTRYQNQR